MMMSFTQKLVSLLGRAWTLKVVCFLAQFPPPPFCTLGVVIFCLLEREKEMPKIVTLCTDFGLRDGYVAAMKGVILSIAPQVCLVDISHQITPQSVREGAFVLRSAYTFFPSGTVHLVVVDPGVGSERRAMAVQAAEHLFVAPDNGVLAYVLRREQQVQAVSLTNPVYWREEVSETFHGRDIFAPVAAHLALGVPLEDLGKPLEELVQLDLPVPERRSNGTIVGHVIHVDGFGNVVTNIPADMLRDCDRWQVMAGKEWIIGLSSTYASAAKGDLVALIGSHGFLEIAVREGSAARIAHLQVGDTVRALRV